MTDFREFLGLGPTKSEQKQAAVAAKVEIKKAAINPEETLRRDYAELDDAGFSTKYGASAMLRRAAEQYQQRQLQDQANLPRVAEEIIGDTINRGASMAASTGAALGSLVPRGLGMVGDVARDANTLKDLLVNPTARLQLATNPGTALEKRQNVADRTADKMLNLGMDVDQMLRERMTFISQADLTLKEQQDAAASAQTKREEQAAIAAGTPGYIATPTRIGKNLANQVGSYADHPTTLVNDIGSQLPMLAMGPIARAGVLEESVAARVAAKQAAGNTSARALLEKEARDTLAERNVVGMVTATESLSNYQQTTSQILQMTPAQLADQYPEAQARLAKGEDFDKVRSEIANKAGAYTAAITAPIAAITSKLASKFELDPLHTGRVAEIPVNILKEGAEETLQSGGGQWAGNVGQQLAGDREVDMAEGVGEAAGQGLAVGAAAAGAFQIPSAMGMAGQATAVGAKLAATSAAGAIKNRLDKMTVASREQAAETGRQAEAVSQRVSEQLRTTVPEQASTLTTPATADPTLTPEAKTQLGLDQDPELDRVSTLGRALNGFMTSEDQSQKGTLALYALRTKREMQKVSSALLDRAAQAPEGEARTAYADLVRHINQLSNSAPMQAIEEAFSTAPEEELQAAFAELPTEALKSVDMHESTKRAIAMVTELAYTAPDRLSEEPVQRALFQSDLPPEDRKQLKLALDLTKIKAAYTAKQEEIKSEYPKIKTSDAVSDEIHEKGFQFKNKNLLSLTDFVREITRSMGSGEVAVARQFINDLHRFATHMANKAQGFDEGAKQQLEIQAKDPKAGREKVTVNFKTLDENGVPTKAKPAFVNIAHKDARGLIDSIFNDAGSVVNTYNTLIKTYPQLATNGTVNVLSKPTWKTYTPAPAQEIQDAQAAEPAPVAPADPVPVASPAEEVATKPTEPVQAEPVAEAAAAPKEEATPGPEQQSSEGEGHHALTLEERRARNRERNAQVSSQEEESKRETIQVGKTRLTYDVSPDNIRLNSLTTPPAERGRGQAQEAMTQFIELLDNRDLPSTLTVAPFGKETVEEKLREFYSRYGYVDQGKDADGNTQMRRPRASEAAQGRAEAKAVSERFPGLRESVGEGFSGQNQFLMAYKLRKGSQAAFARFANPVQDLLSRLREAYKTSAKEAMKALFPQAFQYIELDKPQMEAVGDLLGRLVPELQAQLNLDLRKTAPPSETNKGVLGRFQNDPAKEWSWTNRKTLHVTQDDADGGISYQPQIAEAMALAGIHWALNMSVRPVRNSDENINKLFGKNGIPAELRETFHTAFFFEDPTRELAQQIVQVMGLAPDNSVPIDIVDGMSKQLALEVVNSLHEMGILTLIQKPLPGTHKTLSFFQFNQDDQDNNWSEPQLRTLIPIQKKLRSNSVFTYMLMPGSRDLVSVGKPPTQVGSAMSPEYQTVIENQQKTPRLRNKPLMDVISKLGDLEVLNLFGYQEAIPETTNKINKRSIVGKNRGLESSLREAKQILELQEQYAAANDMSADDVPVFAPYTQISNGRTMEKSFGPQNDKLARQLFSSAHHEFELEDEGMNKMFLLAVAQAMGVKTERMMLDAAITQVTDKLSQPEYEAALGDLLQVLQEDEVDEDFSKEVINKLAAAGIDDARKLDAMLAYARYQQAKANGDKTFKQSLTLELDGITDGPVNANVHFGLHRPINAHTLLQLRQGGWLINDPNHSTMNELGADVGSNGEPMDIYGSVAARVAEAVRFALRQYTGLDQALLREGLNAMQRLGYFKDNKFDRKFAKHPVTAMVYGSGEYAVVTNTAYELMDYVYAQLSDAAAKGETLSQDLQRMIETLAGVKLDDVSQYPTFAFNQHQISMLILNLRGDKESPGIGKMLVEAVEDEMEPILETFKTLYKVSGLQMAALRKAYEKLYKEEHAKLVAEGKLLPFNGLSRNQENQLLEKLKDQRPIYKLLLAQGEGQGLDLTARDNSGRLFLGKTKEGEPLDERVSSLKGNLSIPINALTFASPGVSMASMYTIALGDGTMMAQMLQVLRRALNVYDGYEVPLDRIHGEAEEINQAVFNGWQFDALKAVRESFSQMKLDLDLFSDAEVAALFKDMQLDIEKGVPIKQQLSDLIKETWKDLRQKETYTRVTKQAISELRSAVDHMSSGGNAFIHEGTIVEDPVAYINKRVAELYTQELTKVKEEQTTKQASLVQADPELEKRLGLRSDDKLSATPEMRQLDNIELNILLNSYTFKDKAQQFVVDQLQRLLPENIRVFVGNPEAIARAKAREFPGEDLGTDHDVGTYYKDTLFLSVASPETLSHELVHATTLGLVAAYYRGEKSLTKTQVEAIKDLETLTKAFVEIDTDQLPAQERNAVRHVQRMVKNLLAKEDMPSAVNEYMAWSLTSPVLRNLLTNTKAPEGLVSRVVKSFLKAVRKLLNLPNNAAIESFLEATLGRYRTLTMRAKAPVSTLATALQATYQSLPGKAVSAGQEARIEQTIDMMDRLFLMVPADQKPLADSGLDSKAALLGHEISAEFLQAGFFDTDREKYLFEMVQAVMASSIELDPVTLSTFQDMYNETMKHLGPKDFLEDPTNQNPTTQELSEAADRYHLLFNDYTGKFKHTDAKGVQTPVFEQSNLLANFVALAVVHKPLYDKLAGLRMPSTKIDKGNVDSLLRSVAETAFDKMSDTMLHIRPNDSQQRVLNVLLQRLVSTQEKYVQQRKSKTGLVDEVNNYLKQGMARADEILSDKQKAIMSKTELSSVDGWINILLLGARGMLSDQGAAAVGEGLLRTVNTANVPRVIRSFFAELVGMTDTNEAIFRLLTKSKHVVARVRQRLRDEGPAMVQGLFSRPLPKATWATLYRAAQIDLQAFHGTYTPSQLARMLEDPLALQTAIAAQETRLQGPHQAAWLQGAKDLATWMVQRKNESPLLARNAAALSVLAGSSAVVEAKTAQRMEPILDRLVTLYAVQQMEASDRSTLAQLFQTESQGMTKMLSLLHALSREELGKPGADEQRLNAWKGYVPMALDPRNDLVLAGPTKGTELLKRGYKLVQPYYGDSNDILSGLAYYATSLSGGQATYNQGAMQTIEGSVSGVDALSGRSQDVTVKSYISDMRTVMAITQLKQQGGRSGTRNLLPVFNKKGDIIAYERVLDQALVSKHLGGTHDLSKAVASWMGRQAEEELAKTFNSELVKVLKKNWDDAVVMNLENEFEDISHSSSKITKDAWNNIPREIQKELKQVFGSQVMVRKAMVENVLGYRSASFADFFTGMTDLPENAQKMVKTAVLALLGKDAYKWVVTAERTWEDLVSHAKDWIVVRSGIVSLANATANQFQLLASGVPITQLVQTQLRAVKETEQYLRNERQLAQLRVQIASEVNKDKREKLVRQGKLLNDANSRLSIWPLIMAGELPSIAEGLSEHDQYSILADATGWVQKRIDKLPKGLSTAARYAIISKDTALYQGLNRMIQFGDFMAKAALYQHRLNTGKSSDEALREISETFVNYNLLPGRTRDKLESLGLTWFLNYKIRIQKIVLRTLRDNPLRFLMAGVGAELVDSDSLITSAAPVTNLSYAFGPGQFFRADNMLLWPKLYDKVL